MAKAPKAPTPTTTATEPNKLTNRGMFIYPYKAGSRSVIALSKLADDLKIIRKENSKFKPSKDKIVINWGSIDLPEEICKTCIVLNKPELVHAVSNKLHFFQKVAAADNADRPRIPEWTTTRHEAAKWLTGNKPSTLFARTVLAGHSGEGIEIVTNEEELNKIKEGTLIVKYVPKRAEFRVHISANKDQPFCVQKKVRNVEVPDEQVNFKIRSHENGFIFARNDLTIPPDVIVQAKKAINLSGLDFGAVDVIWNERLEQAFVLEINTAPGLTGTTVEDYANFLKELVA